MSTNPKVYQQLSIEERDLLSALWAHGRSIRRIAHELGRNPSTIYREIRRNGSRYCRDERGSFRSYLPNRAQNKSDRRHRLSHQRARLKNKEIKRYVTRRLKKGWSPQIIAGRLARLYQDRKEMRISHEAIYQWIYAEAPEFVSCLLRRNGKRRRRGYSLKHIKSHIPARISIEERPSDIQSRNEIGHWETDTVSSAEHGTDSLHVMVERKSRYVLLTKITRKDSPCVREAILTRMGKMRRHLRKTLTYDNGPENIGHQLVNHSLGTRSYFCNPYRSWEKGSVENAIGVVRRFFPKKTVFKEIGIKQVKFVENWMNNRPRKCLKFQTPSEVFNRERCT